MKFLCPNCSAKYRIDPEKLAGRPAAKIRCRKCGYDIHITRKGSADDFDISAVPAEAGGQESTAGAPLAGQALQGHTGLDISAGTPAERKAPGGPADPRTAERRGPLGQPAGAPGGLTAPVGGATGGAAAGLPRPNPAPAPPRAAKGGPPRPERGRVEKPGPAPNTTQQLREMVQAGLRESLADAPAVDVPTEDWFVGVNGVPLGPIPLGDLRELVSAGHVDGRSLVWREGWPQWQMLKRVDGLAAILAGALPADAAVDEVPSAVAAAPAPAAAVAPPPAPVAVEARPVVLTAAADASVATGKASAWDDVAQDDDEGDDLATIIQDRPPEALELGLLPEPVAKPERGAPLPGGALATNSLSGAPLAAGGLVPVPASFPVAATVSTPPVVPSRVEPRVRVYLGLAGMACLAVAVIAFLVLRPKSGEEPRGAPQAIQPASDRPMRVITAEELPTSTESDEEDNPSAEPPPPPPDAVPREERSGAGSGASGGRPATSPRAGSSAKPSGQNAPPQTADKGLLAGLAGLQTPGPASASASRATALAAGVGELDGATIEAVVRQYRPSLSRNCWKRAGAAQEFDAPSTARVQIELEIGTSGQVQRATRKGDAKGYPDLAECVERRVRTWQFPRSAGVTTVTVPFVFAAQ